VRTQHHHKIDTEKKFDTEKFAHEEEPPC